MHPSNKGNPLDFLMFPSEGLPPPETTTQFATTSADGLVVIGPKRKNLTFTLALATGPVIFAAIVIPFASNGLTTHFGVHGPRVVWIAAIFTGLLIAALDRFISTRTYRRGPILILDRERNELLLPRSGDSFEAQRVRKAEFISCKVRTDASRLHRGYFWLSQLSIHVENPGSTTIRRLVLTSVYHRRHNGPLEQAIDQFCSAAAIRLDKTRFSADKSIRDDAISQHLKQWRFIP